MNYKEKSALGWEIANWLHKHEEFQVELADNILSVLKWTNVIGVNYHRKDE